MQQALLVPAALPFSWQEETSKSLWFSCSLIPSKRQCSRHQKRLLHCLLLGIKLQLNHKLFEVSSCHEKPGSTKLIYCTNSKRKLASAHFGPVPRSRRV